MKFSRFTMRKMIKMTLNPSFGLSETKTESDHYMEIIEAIDFN